MKGGSVSAQARAGIDRLFRSAMTAHLRVADDDRVEVVSQGETSTKAAAGDRVIAFTIASFALRMVVLFQFPRQAALNDYLTQGREGADPLEVAGELGNLVCGAVNRGLAPHFSVLGLSTPYMLAGPCRAFTSEIDPQYLAHYDVRIDDLHSIGVTVCVCAYAALDFQIAASAEPEAVETGELEMF